MSWLTIRVKYIEKNKEKHEKLVLLPNSILTNMLYNEVIDLIKLKIEEEATNPVNVYSIKVV